MIKLVYCLRRLPELSVEEFQTLWREHAPMVARHAETLRIKRYVQVHTQDHPLNAAMRSTRPGPEPFDGVAELWWATIEDLLAPSSTAEGQAAARELLEDEKRFIDLSQSPIWIAEEHEIVG